MFKMLEKWWESNKRIIKAQCETDSYKGDFYHEWYEDYKQFCKHKNGKIMGYDNWQKILFHNIKK